MELSFLSVSIQKRASETARIHLSAQLYDSFREALSKPCTLTRRIRAAHTGTAINTLSTSSSFAQVIYHLPRDRAREPGCGRSVKGRAAHRGIACTSSLPVSRKLPLLPIFIHPHLTFAASFARIYIIKDCHRRFRESRGSPSQRLRYRPEGWYFASPIPKNPKLLDRSIAARLRAICDARLNPTLSISPPSPGARPDDKVFTAGRLFPTSFRRLSTTKERLP